MWCRTLVALICTVLSACSTTAPPPSGPPAPAVTGIVGRILDAQGTPVEGATVYAYRSARSGLRGPADFAATSDSDGHYLLDLAPGRYHLVARQRRGGSDSGPPRPGDAWALPAVNPVAVSDGELRRLDFTLQQVGNQHFIARTLTTGPFAFSGQLAGPDGRPLPEGMALAYREATLHRRPDFASGPADRDGRFTLYLPDPGPWCLVFRQHTRGQLRRGELHALLGSAQGACHLEALPLSDLGTVSLSPFSGE